MVEVGGDGVFVVRAGEDRAVSEVHLAAVILVFDVAAWGEFAGSYVRRRRADGLRKVKVDSTRSIA